MKNLKRFLQSFALFGMTVFVMTPAFACTNPVGTAGDTMYNKDYSVMQYCDGTNWIAMGRAPGTAACTTGLSEVGSLSNANLDGAYGVDVVGNYAYVSSNVADSLTIIDISTPATPTEVGTISNANLDGARDMVVSGNYAYVASRIADSLTIIDISTPATPTEVGTISNANLDGASGVDVVGNYAYVASFDGSSLTIIDISTPATPTEVGTISNANLFGARGVDVVGNYAYVAVGAGDRFTIIDISNPASPTETGTISNGFTDEARQVAAVGNYAYLTSAFDDNLTIFDISNPASPNMVGLISNANLNSPYGLDVIGNYAYVASNQADSLTIIDISNSASPTQVSTISSANLEGARGLATVGNYSYVASDTADSLTIIEETCTVHDGLVGYWRLDETSGTTATDSSFNNNNGTMTAGLSGTNDSVTGVIENALNFDGTDDYIDVPDTPEYSGGTNKNLSVGIWFYSRAAAGSFDSLITKYDDTFNKDWGLVIDGGALAFGAEVGGNNWDSLNLAGRSGGIVSPNQWHFGVFTIENSTDVILYLDGTNVASFTVPFSIPDTPQNVEIGAITYAPSNTYFDGYLDEARIYDRVLTPAEITTLYNAGRDRGLVGHWKLDETGATTTAIDSSVNANDGTMTGGLSGTDSVTGKIDTALDFDGTDDFISLPNIPATNISLPATISAWIYPDSVGSLMGVMANNRNGNNAHSGIALQISTSGAVSTTFGDNTSCTPSARRSKASSGTITPLKWHHITGIIRGATDMDIYIDGVLDIGGTYSGTGGALAYDGATQGEIGSVENCAGTPENLFDGTIDDVRLYNRELSADEVQALYRERFNICANPDGHEGDIIYNDDNNVMQFCSSAEWMGMGPAGDGGAGCSNPTGSDGDMVYNDDNNVMQYCEGDEWISIGK